jgi:hypothetical protein
MAKLLFPHGVLSGTDVLIDLLDDNQRRVRRAVEGMDDRCLGWRPDPGATSIALTLWHMGRLFDVFLTQHIQGRSAAEECWAAQGWTRRTGYDPQGKGRDGWGTLNEYTPDEIAAIPSLSREQLLDYLGQVYDAARAFLRQTPMESLAAAAPGLGGKFTRYQVLTMVLMDNVRHLGEIAAIKNMWERLTQGENTHDR